MSRDFLTMATLVVVTVTAIVNIAHCVVLYLRFKENR